MSSEPTHPDAERDPEPSEVPVDPVIDDPTAPRDEDLLVARMLEHTIDLPELASAVEAQESADAADTLENLSGSDAARVLARMDVDAAAEALAEMVLPLAASVLVDLVEEDDVVAFGVVGGLSADAQEEAVLHAEGGIAAGGAVDVRLFDMEVPLVRLGRLVPVSDLSGGPGCSRPGIARAV